MRSKAFGRDMGRGERLNKLSDSWFSAKSVKAELGKERHEVEQRIQRRL